jgi:hypothetical protein
MQSLTRRLMSAITVAAGTVMLAAVPLPARADVIWTLSGVTFLDGGTVTGTFTTDNTGILLTWDLTTAGGTLLPGETYDSGTGSVIPAAAPPDTVGFEVLSDDASQYLELQFFGTLVAANSPVTDYEALEFNAAATIDRFNFLVGEAIATPEPMPEPASLALLGAGLVALAMVGRHRVG